MFSNKPKPSECRSDSVVVPNGEPAREHSDYETSQQGQTERQQKSTRNVSY